MFPGSGLFLPETLHRREDARHSQISLDGTRLSHFSLYGSQSRLELKDPGSAPHVPAAVSTMASSEHTIDAFASLATAYNFADFVSTSGGASPDLISLVDLIHKVRTDITEAMRLWISPIVANFLETLPERKLWVDLTLSDSRTALHDIGEFIERSPVSPDYGQTELVRRFEWILSHPKILSEKERILSIRHQSLLGSISFMQPAELFGVASGSSQNLVYEAPVQPWTKSEDDKLLRGPYSRREYRLAHRESSASFVELPDVGSETMLATLPNSYPAELPGSIPDERMTASCRNYHSDAGLSETQLPIKHCMIINSSEQEDVPELVSSNHPSYSRPLPQVLGSSSLKVAVEDKQAFELNNDPASPASTTADTFKRQRETPHRNQNNSRDESIPYGNLGFHRSLPTLEEQSIERSDSILSVKESFHIPIIAKRHHPNPVYIRKRTERHHSLPALPYLQRQSSLAKDLPSHMLSGSASEKLVSAEWNSPHVSLLSTPEVPPAVTQESGSRLKGPTDGLLDTTWMSEPHPSNEEKVQNDIMRKASHHDEMFFPEAHANSIKPKPPDNPIPRQSFERPISATSYNTTSSSIRRKPVPSAQPNASASTISLTRPLSATASVSNISLPLSDSAISSTTTLPLPPNPPLSNEPTCGRSDSQLSTDSIATRASICTPISETSSTTSLHYSEGDHLSTTESRSSDAGPPPVPPKPQTAQMKRRAAHQKRMEMMFRNT